MGISVSNATVMVIYDADRFGMSQLHQLRGRVQRGDKEGLCYLLTASKDEKTLERLKVLSQNNNGFDIADRVIVYYEADESYTKSLEKYLDFIKEETLATDIIKASNLTDEYDVNEYKVLFKVEKK